MVHIKLLSANVPRWKLYLKTQDKNCILKSMLVFFTSIFALLVNRRRGRSVNQRFVLFMFVVTARGLAMFSSNLMIPLWLHYIHCCHIHKICEKACFLSRIFHNLRRAALLLALKTKSCEAPPSSKRRVETASSKSGFPWHKIQPHLVATAKIKHVGSIRIWFHKRWTHVVNSIEKGGKTSGEGANRRCEQHNSFCFSFNFHFVTFLKPSFVFQCSSCLSMDIFIWLRSTLRRMSIILILITIVELSSDSACNRLKNLFPIEFFPVCIPTWQSYVRKKRFGCHMQLKLDWKTESRNSIFYFIGALSEL